MAKEDIKAGVLSKEKHSEILELLAILLDDLDNDFREYYPTQMEHLERMSELIKIQGVGSIQLELMYFIIELDDWGNRFNKIWEALEKILKNLRGTHE